MSATSHGPQRSRGRLILDASVPNIQEPSDLEAMRPSLTAGGVNAVLATVASVEGLPRVRSVLSAWRAWERSPNGVAILARTTTQIRAAAATGKLSITLHAQGLNATEGDVGLIELYARAGVRVAQLTYNFRNEYADGCLETEDAGLSRAGLAALRRLNGLRVVPDVSHTGEASSREIVEASSGPVVATHSNARALCGHPRNLSDRLIRQIASTGGVIGICAFPAFVHEEAPNVMRLAEHAAHIADLVGVGHVGLGLDFSDQDAADYEFYGFDERYYPRPPWTWPAGIGSHRDLPGLAQALDAVGFSEPERDGILGENFMRVFRQTWGS